MQWSISLHATRSVELSLKNYCLNCSKAAGAFVYAQHEPPSYEQKRQSSAVTVIVVK